MTSRAGGAFVLQQLAQQPAFVPHLHLARPAERVHEANHFHMLHAREPLEQYRGLFVRPDGRKQPGDLAGEATRRALTHTQLQAITDLLNDPWQNIPAERRDALQAIQKQTMAEFFPGGSRAGIEA